MNCRHCQQPIKPQRGYHWDQEGTAWCPDGREHEPPLPLLAPKLVFNARPFDLSAPGGIDRLVTLGEALAVAVLSTIDPLHAGDAFEGAPELHLPHDLYTALHLHLDDRGRTVADRMMLICPQLVLRRERSEMQAGPIHPLGKP